MIHSLFRIVIGYILWKYMPSWLRLNNSRVIDHYVIIGLSLIGILMILFGAFHLVECLL